MVEHINSLTNIVVTLLLPVVTSLSRVFFSITAMLFSMSVGLVEVTVVAWPWVWGNLCGWGVALVLVLLFCATTCWCVWVIFACFLLFGILVDKGQFAWFGCVFGLFFLCSGYIRHPCVFFVSLCCNRMRLARVRLNNLLFKKNETLRVTNLFQMKPEAESHFWSTL